MSAPAGKAKPHLRVIGDKLVVVEKSVATQRETPLDAARRRFGRPFAHEAGTNWQPRPVRLLTEWLSTRVKS